ncbi:MAG: FHA domain-containing protein [Brasilonema octagenarum HA4186-MV1]|jgi:pSer/pThr/pTyr-binding forkhead associated (FHA) protein|nr:FHA domain-containing protein [Brasilonema octagenarum HA4186-MV1]
MYSECHFLDVKDPDGNQYTIKLEQQYFAIGRSNNNDIILSNPEKIISRQQCVLKYEAKCWWVVDEFSANGTYVQQGNNSATPIDVRPYGRVRLNDGDAILILGRLLEGEEAGFWRLTLSQPAQPTN